MTTIEEAIRNYSRDTLALESEQTAETYIQEVQPFSESLTAQDIRQSQNQSL